MDIRLFVIPFILICLAVVEVDNRNFLRRNFSEKDLKGYHSPFVALIVCAALFFVLMFLFPSHNDEYKELKEKYDEITYSIDSARQNTITALWYLDGEENITKDEAKSALHNILDTLDY